MWRRRQQAPEHSQPRGWRITPLAGGRAARGAGSSSDFMRQADGSFVAARRQCEGLSAAERSLVRFAGSSARTAALLPHILACASLRRHRFVQRVRARSGPRPKPRAP